ncbi:FtsX-like permease family protein [Dehalobacterium formicoaceticum]|uniref:FtsX-like permease family protein n=1 Tax=Dehalobacterium formicoaceticum TaxID=51515 RepID=A0ABT1Y680_9FIRM|nr:FtsX-like permease family protein [Dehalobacterium formicoaceticum]MCR6546397.1 FtsX-like permease family protein [Dehalobacterium formicoaceticum]
MKSYHALAWKELKTQKITSTLILIAIILSTMMTTVIGQSWGILQALREQQAGMLNGNRYATFHNLTEEQKLFLEKDDRLSFVGSNMTLGTAKLKNSGISLQLREYDEQDLSVYPTVTQLSKGHLPQKAGEIALPQDALDYLGFSGDIGDTVTLSLSISLLQDTEEAYEYQAEFTLCGILRSNYIGYSSGVVTGIAGEGTAEKWLSEKYKLYSTDFRTADKGGFQQTVSDLADKVGVPKSRIQYNWLYLSALGIDYSESDSDESKTSGFSYMTVAGIMIGALVLLAAGLVIYNILKIAVSKRIKEYGTLRAIGAHQGQLYRLVAEELILLCLAGIPIGAILGVISAGGITKAATSLFSPEIFMVQSIQELDKLIAQNSTGKLLPLLVSAAITLVFAFIAAMPAARYAARVSPTVAMHGITSKVKRKNRKDKHIRNFEAFYARLNLKRNTARTAITILSLVMSITVFVAIQSFSGLLDASQDVQKLHLGDYSITNDTIGFNPSVVEDLKLQQGISSVSTLKYSLYKQESDGTLPIETGFKLRPAETLQIIGVDEERLKSLMPALTKDEMQELKDGKACLIKNPIAIAYEGKQTETTSFTAGDTISVANNELKVFGNSDAVGLDNEGFVNGVQVVVFDTVYDQLTGKNTYSELYPILEDGANTQAVEQKIEQICNQTAGSRWLSYQNTDRQLEESYQQIRLIAWGLILFIGLIGLLNIINTTYTNIHTRINEIGMQRAIGMSTASLYKTFLWEGAYYGIIAGAIGAVAGYICTIFVEAAATDQLVFVAVPISPIIQAAFASIVACLIATCIPLSQIAKMSIVDSIETVE